MNYAILAAFLVMALCYAVYQRMKTLPRRSRMPGLLFKCCATCMAAAVCLLGALDGGTTGDWLLLAGLAACMIADGVLALHFPLGIAVFGAGHVLYILAFCVYGAPGLGSLAVFALAMGTLTLLFTRWRTRIGRRLPMFFAYGTLLCAMMALAFSRSPVLFIGALLFTFSDATLAYLIFIRRNVRLDYISLAAYYLGQFLIGLSVVIK